MYQREEEEEEEEEEGEEYGLSVKERVMEKERVEERWRRKPDEEQRYRQPFQSFVSLFSTITCLGTFTL